MLLLEDLFLRLDYCLKIQIGYKRGGGILKIFRIESRKNRCVILHLLYNVQKSRTDYIKKPQRFCSLSNFILWIGENLSRGSEKFFLKMFSSHNKYLKIFILLI